MEEKKRQSGIYRFLFNVFASAANPNMLVNYFPNKSFEIRCWIAATSKSVFVFLLGRARQRSRENRPSTKAVHA